MQRRPFLLAALVAASILPAVAGAAGAAPVNVKHTIDIESNNGHVLVHLTVFNYGRQTIWIPREIALGDDLTAPRFLLRTPEDEVAYTGRMVKRAALGPADYLEVKPQTTHLNTIDITDAYAFKPGKHSYEIRYAGPWLTSLGSLDAASIKQSPALPVKFSFTGR